MLKLLNALTKMDVQTKMLFGHSPTILVNIIDQQRGQLGKVFHKLNRIGSVADVKTPLRARIRRSDENVAAVRESVTEHLETCIRHRTEELNLSTTSLYRIWTKNLSLQP